MSLNLVSEHLLAANGLSHQDLFSILGQLTELSRILGFRRQHY